jgi:hypothetical protein
MGNPPFVGARWMDREQKQDVIDIFGPKWKNIGNLDYVCCWYKKAAELMQSQSDIKAAFVSTNSITQGEQVAILWRNLFEQYHLRIVFAYRTFQWDSEAEMKAHVHCVIVGFKVNGNNASKTIFLNESQSVQAENINGYLMDAPNVWIESRNKPICDVPEIGIGNKPIDGGYYLFTDEEKSEFLKKEPKAQPYFRRWFGAEEFINNKIRWCLWLGDCTPAELRSMPLCYERVRMVYEYRLKSPSPGTVKLADKPTRFHVENMPKGNFIVIPEVSSGRRHYIPIGYMDDSVLCSNKLRLMPQANLFYFGVLTSKIHNAWMRVVCGRLKSDYSYSVNIVYNNFPWCNPTEEQRKRIEQTAQSILDARSQNASSTLADLYDEISMPSELRKAHRENDKAVMAAYGFKPNLEESEIVAELFRMYQGMIKSIH